MTHTTHVVPFKGTTLGTSTTSAGTYTTIAQVVSIGGPSPEMGTRDTTNLSSTVKTCAATILDNGETTAHIQWDPADTTQALLTAELQTPSTPSLFYKITYPDTSTIIFQGVITKFDIKEGTVDDNLEADLTWKINSALTITPTIT